MRRPPTSALFPYTTLFRSLQADGADEARLSTGKVSCHGLVQGFEIEALDCFRHLHLVDLEIPANEDSEDVPHMCVAVNALVQHRLDDARRRRPEVLRLVLAGEQPRRRRVRLAEGLRLLPLPRLGERGCDGLLDVRAVAARVRGEERGLG